MKVGCPTCGAEVEFRFDDSFVRVCAHCRSAVARTDRGIETLGQFADIVPIESRLRLFADGQYPPYSFILIGMAQLQHGSGGVWQEWYAKLGSGHWGWLSEAQGRLYMTFERPGIAVPPIEALHPNTQIQIEGKTYVVAERGTARYLSAQGEIPYRLVPNTQFNFVDLSDGRGGFATIDFGDDGTPTIYVGQEVTADQLRISGGDAAPAPSAARATAGLALKCPNCGGSLELKAPDQSLRVGCPYCETLVSVESGQLAIIAKQSRKPKLLLPLGSKGKLPEGEFTVIGWVARSAQIDGKWYPFEEYLLHAPDLGFRWMVCSDGHWSYVQPIATGAVSQETEPKYEGVRFKHYQRSQLRVDAVLGELYWRVAIGEKVEANDYVAPPAMLSREYSSDEQNWSLSTYMTHAEVKRAFNTLWSLGTKVGVAPNQSYPGRVGLVVALFTIALFGVGIAKFATSKNLLKHVEQITVPVGPGTAPPPDPTDPPPAAGEPPAEAAGHITFTKTFKLETRNLEIGVQAGIANNWAYVAIDLVNEKTGQLISFDQSLEYYSGVEGGESWSEGSTSESEVLGPVDAGDYLLRIEAQQGGTAPITMNVTVVQGVFRLRWFLVALGILMLPFGIVFMHASAFNKKRWENSNTIVHSGDDG